MCPSRGHTTRPDAHDLSEDRSRQALEIAPGLPVALSNLGYAYSLQGRHEEAIDLLEKASLQGAASYFPAESLGKAYVRAGMRSDAERLLAELQARREEGRYVPAVTIAIVAAALDQHDAAFEWLETAVTERDPNLHWNLKTEPDFAPLRTDPRYAAILRRMNLMA